MSLTKYDYAKETHLVLLSQEIEASTITIALDRIDYEPTTTSVWFKAALATGEAAILDSIVAAHDKDSYVAPQEKITAELVRQEENDANIPYVYSSARPMNHYSYFSSVGDSVGIGDGNQLFFNLTAGDVSKTVDITYNEHVYLKDGLIMCTDAPFGALVDIDIYHPVFGFLLSFGKKVPVYGNFPIMLNTEDRASVPPGLIVRVTVFNSDGQDGRDPASAFRVFGRLELYRPKPPGA